MCPRKRTEWSIKMDITPLYDLRERLRAGAVAGAGLAAEDFRLRRAVEAMVPLEKAAFGTDSDGGV